MNGFSVVDGFSFEPPLATDRTYPWNLFGFSVKLEFEAFFQQGLEHRPKLRVRRGRWILNLRVHGKRMGRDPLRTSGHFGPVRANHQPSKRG